MSNLPNAAHPPWCLRGPDCVGGNGLHLSRLVGAAVRGDEVIQAGVGLWRMDVGPTSPSGLLLELSADEEVERWPLDLPQSRALVRASPRLLRRLAPPAVHAACPPVRPSHRTAPLGSARLGGTLWVSRLPFDTHNVPLTASGGRRWNATGVSAPG
ncbi:hypothetical protein [Micromonospora sp. NPDC049282]|uniref:hypothetical protein n=1 Tax=Micromonospora sp. NPDC049282 TaxID=3364269 RepID=UPI00371589B1